MGYIARIGTALLTSLAVGDLEGSFIEVQRRVQVITKVTGVCTRAKGEQ